MMRTTTLRVSSLIMLFGGLLFLASCSKKTDSKGSPKGAAASGVMVRADVTLQQPLLEIARNYQMETFVPMLLKFATSFEVLSDSAEDSVDVYIFANDQFVDLGRKTNAVDSSGEITVAYMVPCLIVPRFNPAMVTSLSDLENPDLRIGIVNPASDILGVFALEILKRNRLYDELKHRLIVADQTAQNLAERIARTDVDVGIGWTSFTQLNPGSFDVILLLPSEIPRIAAVTAVRAKTPVDSVKANHLITYLKSDRCGNVFREWGYFVSKDDLAYYAPAATIGGNATR